ncbi:MAG: hypothetical protein M5U17_01765 [Ignavibacterium sp.]|nr:hypothetical protein [Ignavibacterium sp.]
MNLDWITTIPDYIQYFNDDHRLIINLIGFDNYIKLYQYFGKTGVYFAMHHDDSPGCDKIIATKLIGEDNFKKLFYNFYKTGIYFSSSPILELKKAWARDNRHIDNKTAARTLDVSMMTIYRWRSDDSGIKKK